MRRWIIGLVVLGVVVVAVLALREGGPFGPPAPTPVPVAVQARPVTAEGIVTPGRHGRLAFKAAGRVASIEATEGDRVEAGQALVKLDASDQGLALAAAQASLALARASYAQLVAGSRAEDIAIAEAGLKAAEARLAQLKAGATTNAVEAAQRQAQQARNGLAAAQAWRDAVCGNEQKYEYTTSCDVENANAGRAYEAWMVAEAQLRDLTAPPRPEAVAQTEAEVATAQARLALARAPYRSQDVAVANARVEQAEAAVAQARQAITDTQLTAPYAGTVGKLLVHVGEVVAPGTPAIEFGDLSRLLIETDDLDETAAAKVRVGQRVSVTAYALEDTVFTGRVTAISPFGTKTAGGDVNYTATIELDGGDRGLRWGMTTKVEFLD